MLTLPLPLLAFASGCWLAGPVFRLGGRLEVALIGMALAVPLSLLCLSLLLRAGSPLTWAVYGAPVLLALLAAPAARRPDCSRAGPSLTRSERAGLMVATLSAWLFLNMMQVITVDDDYWLHAPVQGRMLRGIVPPTNPYFPDLVLGGHFGRDTLVVATSLWTKRDIFGAQVLLSSFCHSLGLAILYLALRRSGTAAAATAGTFMAWLGMNVAHRVGLLDFFQNNGPPTYLTVALLALLFSELWHRPGRKLALLCGAVLGVYAQIYETHFGLVVLSVVSMQAFLSWPARKASLAALTVAGLLALTGSTAIAQLARPKQALDNAVANQSQSVRVSFPKNPFMSLRVEVGELHPISIGYRTPLGARILKAVDHESSRVNAQYVRLWSWEVMRMHWLAVWLAPLSAWLVLRARHRAAGFLWLFGAWAFLVPGMLDFGPIHEYEWYRWEFAAGYGLSTAFGVGLASQIRGKASGLAVTALLLVQSRAGLGFVSDYLRHLGNPRPAEVLGLSFDSRAWLIRHGQHLRLQPADLRMAKLLAANPEVGRDAFVYTSGIQQGWGILFESTLMALIDLQVRGHKMPSDLPVGVPPFQFSDAFMDFLDHPGREKAHTLDFDWLFLRSSDVQLEGRLMAALHLVALDSLSQDGNVRLLFQVDDKPVRAPSLRGDARFEKVSFGTAPAGCTQVQLGFLDIQENPMLRPVTLAAPNAPVWVAVPDGCQKIEILFLALNGPLERRLLPVESLTPKGE